MAAANTEVIRSVCRFLSQISGLMESNSSLVSVQYRKKFFSVLIFTGSSPFSAAVVKWQCNVFCNHYTITDKLL